MAGPIGAGQPRKQNESEGGRAKANDRRERESKPRRRAGGTHGKPGKRASERTAKERARSRLVGESHKA